MPHDDKALTTRQHRFVIEYVQGKTATQAAVAAGFSEKGAHVTANRLLQKATICAAIATARGPALDNAKLTLEGHLQRLADLSEQAREAGQFGPAIKAEESRGKVAGFYVDRSEVSGADGTPLAITVTRKLLRADARVADEGDASP